MIPFSIQIIRTKYKYNKSTMGFIILIAVIFVGGGIFGAIAMSNEEKKEAEVRKAAISKAKTGFIETAVIKDDEARLYFSIDDISNEIFCYSNYKEIRFKYQDIINVEVIENDVTISNKSVSLGGALAGGVLAGGIGAVVGGSSMGKTTSTKDLVKLVVRIRLRNCSVNSFDVGCRRRFESYPYTAAYKNAQEVYDCLIVAMDKVRPKTEEPKISSSKSTVDELKELAELKQQGLITEEDFAAMKAKIIKK